MSLFLVLHVSGVYLFRVKITEMKTPERVLEKSFAKRPHAPEFYRVKGAIWPVIV